MATKAKKAAVKKAAKAAAAPKAKAKRRAGKGHVINEEKAAREIRVAKRARVSEKKKAAKAERTKAWAEKRAAAKRSGNSAVVARDSNTNHIYAIPNGFYVNWQRRGHIYRAAFTTTRFGTVPAALAKAKQEVAFLDSHASEIERNISKDGDRANIKRIVLRVKEANGVKLAVPAEKRPTRKLSVVRKVAKPLKKAAKAARRVVKAAGAATAAVVAKPQQQQQQQPTGTGFIAEAVSPADEITMAEMGARG